MLKTNVKNIKINNIFFTSLPEQQNIIEALYTLILILLSKYLIFRLIWDHQSVSYIPDTGSL